ncbi:MAG TPA: nicotinamide riboside transporter PnuC [Flavobacterium sp.]|jgi:nicotinamide mononucleotide transporter|uniref:nicotinamide riboside transporter PnuC n=1 Tax=Flavobacterium sp. TaxID=239 RepID=UPI002BFB4967|nr:nicotinamide riboside transporter PnuC [Flavobacterium sp.]HPW98783.1 nicotinamide riboside transporter PnuC [Flavobacterium sp.]HQA74997.1 nicotinamide riboside transporter PnuC [Flavobacterium sp.]
MFDYLFAQYANYPTHEIILEITAVLFGLLSVWYAKKNNVLVFPTGLISTMIYVYLLWKWSLLGDMIINGYYAIMSIYGWYHWTRKKEDVVEFPISITTKKEHVWSWILFVAAMLFVIFVYNYFDKFTSWTAYIDTLTTGIFFAAMWLMAKRKIENWILWIIGDIISIPLYFYKGYTFTSIQYIIFTIIAIYGYLEWKRILQQKNN